MPTDIYRHDIEFGLRNLPSYEGADGTIGIVKKDQARMFDRGSEHIIKIGFMEELGLSWTYSELITAPEAAETTNKNIAADDGGNDNYEFHDLGIWSVPIQMSFEGATVPRIADLISRLCRSTRAWRFRHALVFNQYEVCPV